MKITFLLATVFFVQIAFSQQTETRKLSSFKKLYVSGTIDVLVQKGNEESVKIVSKGVVTGRVITETSGDDLHIYMDDGDYHDINVKVFVTYKEIVSVEKGGSGNIEWLSPLDISDFDFLMNDAGNCNFKEKIKTANFNLIKSGSGNINLTNIESNAATFNVSGSGKLSIESGSIKKEIIEQSGSATITAAGLSTEDCNASVSGSGNIEVTVTGILEAKIAGAGNIIYNGNAQVNKKTVAGSGKITKRS